MKKLMVSLALLLCCVIGEAKVDTIIDTVRVNNTEYIFCIKRNKHTVKIVPPAGEAYSRYFEGKEHYDHYRDITNRFLNKTTNTESQVTSVAPAVQQVDSTAIRNAWKEYYEKNYAPFYSDPNNLKKMIEMSLWCESIEKKDNMYYIKNDDPLIKDIYKKYDGVVFTSDYCFTADGVSVDNIDDIKKKMNERWNNI